VNGWDLVTWAAVMVLGPGAVVVFGLFLRDLGRLWREIGCPKPGAESGPPAQPHSRAISARSAGGTG
jgi:hypothetical protein